MKNIAFCTIVELQELLQTGAISAQEVYDVMARRLAQYNKTLNCTVEVFEKEFVTTAGVGKGNLFGIPGLIKDNIAITGRKLTCASKILEGFVSPYDATVIARLKKQGALLMGRANMDEFAMGSSTENSIYGVAKNPWNLDCVAGGSSGGSAVAVAAGLSHWALGSETGGSVRQPASLCGIVGMKPSYGRISRYGLVAYGSSLDQVGIFTRTVKDNALVLQALAGADAHDATTTDIVPDDYVSDLHETIARAFPSGVTIGVLEDSIGAAGMDVDVSGALQQAIDHLGTQGARIKRVSIDALERSAAAYLIISRAEAASNLARFDGVRYGFSRQDSKTLDELYINTRHEGFSKEVRLRIMVGNYVLSAGHAAQFYGKACDVRNALKQSFADAFKEVDVILMPTHPAPAFVRGAFAQDKLQLDLQDSFTCPVNLAGLPAIAIPCGFSSAGMPIGMQFVGPCCAEKLLYKIAHVYEQSTDWHTKQPKSYLE